MLWAGGISHAHFSVRWWAWWICDFFCPVEAWFYEFPPFCNKAILCDMIKSVRSPGTWKLVTLNLSPSLGKRKELILHSKSQRKFHSQISKKQTNKKPKIKNDNCNASFLRKLLEKIRYQKWGSWFEKKRRGIQETKSLSQRNGKTSQDAVS